MWQDAKHFCSNAVRLIQCDKQWPIVAVHLVNTNQINYVRLTYRRSCRASLLCKERHEIGLISGCRWVLFTQKKSGGGVFLWLTFGFDKGLSEDAHAAGTFFPLIAWMMSWRLRFSWFLQATSILRVIFPPWSQVSRVNLHRTETKCFCLHPHILFISVFISAHWPAYESGGARLCHFKGLSAM